MKSFAQCGGASSSGGERGGATKRRSETQPKRRKRRPPHKQQQRRQQPHARRRVPAAGGAAETTRRAAAAAGTWLCLVGKKPRPGGQQKGAALLAAPRLAGVSSPFLSPPQHPTPRRPAPAPIHYHFPRCCRPPASGAPAAAGPRSGCCHGHMLPARRARCGRAAPVLRTRRSECDARYAQKNTPPNHNPPVQNGTAKAGAVRGRIAG